MSNGLHRDTGPVRDVLGRKRVAPECSQDLCATIGGTEPALSVGIISAKNRMHSNAVQTDAKLSPLNFGGPLCDIHGRVVGITVPMAQRPGELAGVEMYDSGVGFAVPKHRLDAIVSELRTGRSFYRGWLGGAGLRSQIWRSGNAACLQSCVQRGDVVREHGFWHVSWSYVRRVFSDPRSCKRHIKAHFFAEHGVV